MARFAPHANLYKTIGYLRTSTTWLFWIVFGVSVLLTLLTIPHSVFSANGNAEAIKQVLELTDAIVILLFFTVDIIIDYVLFPQAENKRRDDFLDNSLGSKFSTNSSVDYYDNEEIATGLHKAATNQFENCFFTYNLLKALTFGKVIVPSVVFLAIWVFAFYGFHNVSVAVSFLQVFFSVNVLGGLIRHLILLSRLSVIYDNWVTLFQDDNFKNNPSKYQSHILRYWLRYETLHSTIPADIPQSFFDKMNLSLTNEWMALKAKYQIQ